MAKVLIVEDEGSLLSVYTEVLEASGHEVLQASDGDSGLETALNNDWSLMFLDIMLPGVDGISILKRLNEAGKTKTGVIYVLSNLDNSSIINECLQNGAKEHLKKIEMTPESILEIVDTYVTEQT